ncbi:hypothetical protein AB1N83_012905 [Pleurotus pulmonarius]
MEAETVPVRGDDQWPRFCIRGYIIHPFRSNTLSSRRLALLFASMSSPPFATPTCRLRTIPCQRFSLDAGREMKRFVDNDDLQRNDGTDARGKGGDDPVHSEDATDIKITPPSSIRRRRLTNRNAVVVANANANSNSNVNNININSNNNNNNINFFTLITDDTSPTVPPTRDSVQFSTLSITEFIPTAVTSRDTPPTQRPDATTATTPPTIPTIALTRDSSQPPTETSTETPPAVLPGTVTNAGSSLTVLPTSHSGQSSSTTTISSSLTVLFTPETTSSPINFLTQAPIETDIPTTAPAPAPAKPRFDRRTIVGLSVGLGLLLVAAMAFAGFRVFKKVKPRILRAMIHRRPENIIEAYRESSTSSGGTTPLIPSRGVLYWYTPRAEGKNSGFLSELYSDPDVEAGRTLATSHHSTDSTGRRGSPLASNSTRTSVLSDSSDDAGSLASLPSYHSRRL